MQKLKIDRILTAKILTGVACVGVVVTGYFAIKRGEKVTKKIEETKAELETDENKDKSKLEVSARYISRVAPVIAPVVIAGGITEACIIGAQILSLKEIAALTGTVSFLIANRQALEEAICELPGGKEALEKAKKKVATMTAEKKIEEDKKTKHVPWKCQTIEDTGNGDDLFIDEWSGRVFKSSVEHVQAGIDKINDERDEGMDLPFSERPDVNFPIATAYNDFYVAWDLEPTGLGATFGFPASDDWYDSRRIDFKIITLDQKDMDPVMWERYGQRIHLISLNPDYYPMACYLEY